MIMRNHLKGSLSSFQEEQNAEIGRQSFVGSFDSLFHPFLFVFSLWLRTQNLDADVYSIHRMKTERMTD